MILDDIFEALKPSDMPTYLRRQAGKPDLTLRDIDKERPQGAYRYRVGDKEFMSLGPAAEYAKGTGQSVQTIKLDEQGQVEPDVLRGMENLRNLETNANNDIAVYIKNQTGRVKYQVKLPGDKAWVIGHAKEWTDAGKAQDLYRFMGTAEGFDFLLTAWEKEDAKARAQQTQQPEPEPGDLFSPAQAGGAKSPRMQGESALSQKKRSEVAEAPAGARGRTERMMSKMRARQPQATSDVEALAYELEDAERRDSQEITKLEKEVDSLETDIKSELQKRIATLTRRRGGIQQSAEKDTKTDAVLDQLSRVNDEQQKEINNLEKAVANLSDVSKSIKVSLPKAEPAKAPEIKPAVAPRVVLPAIKARAPAAPVPASPVKSEPASITPAVPADEPAANEPDLDPAQRRQRFSLAKQAAESTTEGIMDRIGRAVGFQPTISPFRDLTSAEKAMNIRSNVAASAKAQGKPGLYRQQQQGLQNLAQSEKQKIQTQIADIQKQIKQANIAGDVNKARDLQRQSTMLQQRAGMFKQDVASARTAAGTAAPKSTATSPGGAGAFGSMVGQLTGTPMPTTAPSPTATGAPTNPTAASSTTTTVPPSGWRMGQPITVGGQVIRPRDPNYQKIAQQLVKQGVQEQHLNEKKKRPTPTNPSLWSRAKSAARSKFDVYPSAYANAWAAKWYKSKGGGWRMGKGPKKGAEE